MTTRVALKKFRIGMAYSRTATPDDLADDALRVAQGQQSRLIDGGSKIEFPAAECDLPGDYAAELVTRGLVEIIQDAGPVKPKTIGKKAA